MRDRREGGREGGKEGGREGEREEGREGGLQWRELGALSSTPDEQLLHSLHLLRSDDA